MARSALPLRNPIAKGQIQLIKIAQKQLGIDDEDYRSLLWNLFRATSCTQLTVAQGTRLIEHFETLGFRTRNTERRSQSASYASRKTGTRQYVPRASDGKLVRLAGREEHAKISALAGLIRWEEADGLSRWMDHRFGFSRVRTSREAWLVIEGLKKMFAGGMARAHGKDWWGKRFSDSGVMRFIKEHAPEEYR